MFALGALLGPVVLVVNLELRVIQPLRAPGLKRDAHDAWATADTMWLQSADTTRVFKSSRTLTAFRNVEHVFDLVDLVVDLATHVRLQVAEVAGEQELILLTRYPNRLRY